MDARVLHVTVVRPWGEKNGQDGDTRSPPSAPSPRLLSLGLFRENPGQGRDLFPLTDLRTRGPDVGPFAQTSPSRQCPLKIPFSPIENFSPSFFLSFPDRRLSISFPPLLSFLSLSIDS